MDVIYGYTILPGIFFSLGFSSGFIPLTSAQGNGSAKPTTNESNLFSEEVTLVALVLAVLATVGVVFLCVIVFCLIARLRTEKRKLPRYSSSWDVGEKSPPPILRDQDFTLQVTRTPQATKQGNVNVGVGTLRQVSLSLLQDLLLNLYNVSVKRGDHSSGRLDSVTSNESEQLTITSAGASEVQKQLKNGLLKIFPFDQAKVESFLSLGQGIMTATSVRQLMDSAFRVMRVCVGVIREWSVASEDFVGVVPTEGQGHVSIEIEDEINSLKLTWDAHKFSVDLLKTVSMVFQAMRDERRQPTPEEYLAVQMAYHLLGKGQQIYKGKHRPIGSPGFRPHVQTQLALTDSGYGHVMGTTRRSDWLQGVVVHVQHIGSLEEDSDIAPSIFDFGKVRLHVGEAAPTTFYVSRRFAQAAKGETIPPHVWEAELSKLVQLTANSISSAFYQGAAACHISMAGLTTSQAAAFMTQLRPHVHRERHLQTLSAVWDLGTPLTDDYLTEEEKVEGFEGHPIIQRTHVIQEPHHIAHRAIEITLVGGFDQVTWFSSCSDSGNNKSSQSDYTECVLRHLTSQQIISLVHQAHSLGLLTYFTGGVTCQDIQPAVLGGVDGVGVGGVGMLHHVKAGRNLREKHGPYMEENIPQLLACRDEAARSTVGRGAHLLTRLDTMFFEGSLASTENALRTQLYNALVDKNEATIRSILSKFEDVMQLPGEFGHPLMGMARRLVARKAPALKDVADSAYEWAMFVTRLKSLVARGDESSVCEEYGGEPWHTYRRKYREHREGPQGYFRQVSFQVALKTDF